MAEAAARQRFDLRILLLGLGNLLLGLSLGLLATYAVTSLVGRAEQTRATAQAPKAMLSEATMPGPVLDFGGWENQDAAYWRSLAEGRAFGRIRIARIGLDMVVVKGTSRADLKKGPGWITWTDLPGATGNVGISGHRTTYLAPFRHLDRMRAGDTIELYSPYRVYRYRVRRVFVVAPDRTDVVASTEQPMLTLTACHPPYSARQRIIVQSDLIEVRRLADAAAPAQ